MRTLLAGFLILASAAPALAQRYPFERAFDVTASPRLDVRTERGRIDVVAGDPGRIVVTGTVTVRVGWNVPADAIALAQKLAAAPPIEQAGDTIRLRPPADDATRRAVTVSYQVRVPPTTGVRTTSDSGATTVRGVAAAIEVETQSAAIDLSSLGGAASVTTGSGAVKIDGVAGALTVRTSSSAITAHGVGSSLHLRTGSGRIDAALTGSGDADLETSSSAIDLRGARGGVIANTQSGHVTVEGTPARAWTITSGSSGMDVTVPKDAAFSLDAKSGSGTVAVEGGTIQGSASSRSASGSVNGGGPRVALTSRSGSIRVAVR